MTANGRRHDRFRELAATALDFPLTAAEAAELDAHLAGCPACARLAGGLRFDALALRRPAELATSYRLDTAIGAAIAGRPVRRSPTQTLLLVAATALILVAILGAAAVGAFLWRTLQPPLVVVDPSPAPPVVVVDPSASPAPSGEPGPAVPALTWQLAEFPPMFAGGQSHPAAVIVAGGDAPLVAVGGRVFRDNGTPSGGTASAWRSEDGLAWTPATADAGLALGDGIFIDDYPTPGLVDVAWGPSGFVAVGVSRITDREGGAWFSPDGVAWTRADFPGAARARPAAVTWTGGAFVAVGVVEEEGAPRGAAWISADGRSWERAPDGAAFEIGGYITLPSGYATGGPVDVVVLPDGSLLAPSRTCTATADMEEQPICRPFVMASRNGETWEREELPGEVRPGSVAAARDRVVALAGSAENGSAVVMVRDAEGWRPVDLPGVPALARVIAYGDGFLAVSIAGDEVSLYSSADGETWVGLPGIPQPSDVAVLRTEVDLATDGRSVVVVGSAETESGPGPGGFAIVGSAAASDDPTESPVPPPLPTDSLLLAVAGNEVIVTITPDGETYESLAGGDAAAWSPDGRRIVYACRPSEARDVPPATNICVMNADGTGQRRIVEGGLAPSWSPDGAQVMFSRSVIDAGDTWTANADGSNSRKVGDGTGTWSPDGSRILLVGASGAAPDVTVVRPDGSGARQLGDCWNAAWSPDGRRLACTRWDEPKGTLFTIDVATGTTSALLEAEVAISDPTWVSAEPEQLAITMARSGTDPSALAPENDLYLFRPGAGEPARLTTGLSVEGPIGVSPEGAWLAFTAVDGDTRNVHVVSTAGDEHQVTGNGTTGSPRWQPRQATGPAAPSTPSGKPPGATWEYAADAIPASGGSVALASYRLDQVVAVVSEPGDPLAGRPSRSAVTVVDGKGFPARGWPVAVEGWSCDNPNGIPWPPVASDDGAVTVTCVSDETPEGRFWTAAFRFDGSGEVRSAWYLEGITQDHAPRVVGDQLLAVHRRADGQEVTLPDGSSAYRYATTEWLERVGVGSTATKGTAVPSDVAGGSLAIGPDGIAYDVDSKVTAFDMDGLRPGWPVAVDGVPSRPAFGPDGRIYLTVTVNDPDAPATTRLVAIDRGGRVVVESAPLPIAGTLAWTGAGPDNRPIAPLVAPDGSVAYVIGQADGVASVYAIDEAGRVVDGWPYRAPGAMQTRGGCDPPATGCGEWRADAAVGRDGTLYVPLEQGRSGRGGSAVAIQRDGSLLAGWPGDWCADDACWSMVPGSNGSVAAFMLSHEEPTADGAVASAAVLAVGTDGGEVSWPAVCGLPGGCVTREP